MNQREALQLALEALEVNLGTWSAKKKAIPAIKEVLAQQEYQGSDAAKAAHMMDLYEALGVKWGDDPFPVIAKLREAQPEQEPVAITITGKLGNIYSFTGDYSLKKGDKVYTTQPQPEPVIDKSAAIRIATSLGWEPKRKPLTIVELQKHWQVAKVLDMTDSEISFSDYVLITKDVEALHGIKEKNT